MSLLGRNTSIASDSSFAPKSDSSCDLSKSENSNSSSEANKSAERDLKDRDAPFKTPVEERFGSLDVYTLWTKLDDKIEVDRDAKRAKQNVVVRCNGCRKFVERADNIKLCRHSASCTGLPVHIRMQAEQWKGAAIAAASQKKTAKKSLLKQDMDKVRVAVGVAGSPTGGAQPVSMAASFGQSQSTLLNYGVTKISSEAKKITDRRVAEYIYLRGHSFAEVDAPEFRRMFEGLVGTAYAPPSRKYIADKALKIISTDVKSQVAEVLKVCNHGVLILDGWEDSSNVAIVNCLLHVYDLETGTSRTLFWGAKHVKALQRETIEWIANIIKEVKLEIATSLELHGAVMGDFKIIGAIGDRAANERGARASAAEDGTIMFSLACAAHGLHNMVKRICEIPELASIIATSKAVVTDLTKSRKIKIALRGYLRRNVSKIADPKTGKDILVKAPCRMLCTIYEIRWGSVQTMHERLWMGEQPLKQFWCNEVFAPPIGQKLEVGEAFTAAMTTSNHQFFLDQRKMCLILGPFQSGLTLSEADYCNQSIMYSTLNIIRSSVLPLAFNHFGTRVRDAIARILEENIATIVSPIMHLAYVLDATQYHDPGNFVLRCRVGGTISDFKRLEISALRQYVSHHKDEDQTQMVTELEQEIYDFKNGTHSMFTDSITGPSCKAFLQKIQGCKVGERKNQNASFWRQYGGTGKLRQLAITINFIPGSSADAERNFSAYVAMSEGRECLGLEKRDELIHVQHNLRLLDPRLKAEAEKKATWKRKTSEKYVSKLTKSLTEGSITSFDEICATEYKLRSSNGAGIESSEEDSLFTEAPDWLDECRFRMQRLKNTLSDGKVLSAAQEAEMNMLVSAASIFEEDRVDHSTDAPPGLTAAASPIPVGRDKFVSKSVEDDEPSFSSDDERRSSLSVTGKPSISTSSASSSSVAHGVECNCKKLGVVRFDNRAIVGCEGIDQQCFDVYQHAVFAICESEVVPLHRATCYKSKGWLRSDVVNLLMATNIRPLAKELGFGDDASFGGLVIVKDVVVLEPDSKFEKAAFCSLVETLSTRLKMDVDYSAGSDVELDDLTEAAQLLILQPVWQTNHFSLLLIVGGEHRKTCFVTIVEGYANAFFPFATLVLNMVKESKMFKEVKRYVTPEEDAFKQAGTRNCGFLVVDSAYHLIRDFVPKMQTKALMMENIGSNIKQAFANASDRWPQVTAKHKGPLTGRLALAVSLYNHVEWLRTFDDSVAMLRTKLSIERPLGEPKGSVFEVLQSRGMEVLYKALRLDEVMSTEKTKEGVVSFVFDHEKLVKLASNRDQYKLGFYYSDDYGFIVASFADFSSKNRARYVEAPRFVEVTKSTKTVKGPDGTTVMPTKKQKVVDKTKVKVDVSYDEGYADDHQVNFITLRVDRYGIVDGRHASRDGGWVILERRDASGSCLRDDTAAGGAIVDESLGLRAISIGNCAAYYDASSKGWRPGVVSSILSSLVPHEVMLSSFPNNVPVRLPETDVVVLRATRSDIVAHFKEK